MRTLAAFLLAATACATSHPVARGGPRGLHADEHLAAARVHDELAARATRWPDTRSAGPGAVYVPWTQDSSGEHARLAAVHRSEAAALEAEYTAACGARGSEQVAVSPLVRFGLGGWNTSTGVILYLSADAGPADRLLADLRCHRAWMMLAGAGGGMDDCPLDLPGLLLDAHGDGENAIITLAISVVDPRLVPELQRRAAHELEAALTPR